ncbi:MAG: DUF502 domain-containing protein, partial [Cyclobacteriaceae bacterium]
MKHLIKYFLTGLAVLLPIALTTLAIYFLISKISDLLNFENAEISLIAAILIILLVGIAASKFVGSSMILYAEKLLLKMPFLGFLYKASKDITSAFFGTENKFSEPVLAKISGGDVFRAGFITSKDAASLIGLKGKEDLVSVYFPISYSIAGDLLFIPAENITPLNKKSKDV